MVNSTDDFIRRALREFMGLLKTCGDAIGFGEKQQSVIGARLGASHKADYQKTEAVIKEMASKTQEIADKTQGLDVKVDTKPTGPRS